MKGLGAGVSEGVSEYACEGGFVSSNDCRFAETDDGTVRIVDVAGTEGVLAARDRSVSGALTCASAASELLLLRL